MYEGVDIIFVIQVLHNRFFLWETWKFLSFYAFYLYLLLATVSYSKRVWFSFCMCHYFQPTTVSLRNLGGTTCNTGGVWGVSVEMVHMCLTQTPTDSTWPLSFKPWWDCSDKSVSSTQQWSMKLVSSCMWMVLLCLCWWSGDGKLMWYTFLSSGM